MKEISKKSILYIIFMLAMTALFMYSLLIVWNTIQIGISITLTVTAISVLACGIIAKLKDSDSIFKMCMITIYVGVILMIFYDILVLSGFLDRFDDYNELKTFINSTGGKSEVIFVIAQFLQVTFIPIPSNIVVMVGDELFGPVKAFFLSMIGLLIGSMLAFFLGKTFGLKLVTWLAGKEAVDKYQQIVKGRDKALLTMMFIFPFFPDDLLCLIAGLTTMGYRSFFFIMLISRTLAIGGTILVKNGLLNLIPFSGWGIPIWTLLIVMMVFAFVYTVKYGDKIEAYMLKVMDKFKCSDRNKTCPIEKGECHENKNIINEDKITLYSENNASKDKKEIIDYDLKVLDSKK